MSDKPLNGIRVLDLTVALAGPLCTLNLAGMGAEVIKIEQPGGSDIGRWNPPYVSSEGVHFDSPAEGDISLSMLNRSRGKKSVTLNLKTETGISLFRELVAKSDVVIENFSDGTTERLGIDYESVRDANPEIIYCSLSGLGVGNPSPELKAMDVVIQALSGVMSVTGEPNGAPTRIGIPIGDVIAPLYATNGILAALHYRQQSGNGQFIEVSLLDCLAGLVALEHFPVLEEAGMPTRTGNQLNRLAPFGIFPAADGYVSIAAANDHFAAELFAGMQMPELKEDVRFATRGSRAANAAELNRIIEHWTTRHTRDHIVEVLMKARGVPVAPVRAPAEVVDDVHLQERKAIVDMVHPTVPDAAPIKGQGIPIKFSATPSSLDTPAPVLGQDNEGVYCDLIGLDSPQFEKLREQNII